MLDALRARDEWKFFGVLPRADRTLALLWWFLLVLRGLLPALFAISMGVLVGAVQHHESLIAPLAAVGVIFVLLQILSPIHQALGSNLGSRLAAWLYDVYTAARDGSPRRSALDDRSHNGARF